MRQFVATSPLSDAGLLYVEGKDYKYLKNVLRIKSGDMVSVRLTDGKLVDMTACKVDFSSKKITLQLCDTLTNVTENNICNHALDKELENSSRIVLLQFIAKPQKMDLIIRQAVECGVSEIVPVIGEYCQGYSLRNERWDRIIREALGQCGSAVQTKVVEPMKLTDALNYIQADDRESSLCLVLYERSNDTVSIHKAIASKEDIKKVVIAVGAEGGISPEEIDEMAKSGFAKVHLTTNILRCETAALYGIAAVQVSCAEREEWQYKE